MGKLRVAVVRGGPSAEYDVSLKTGECVLDALSHEHNTSKYDPIDVIISRKGEWLVRGYVRDPRTVVDSVDAVFLALHGSYGEDGQIQRFLDEVHVPYTGSGAYQSAIAMNKVITKDMLKQYGVRMPRHMLIGQSAKHNLTGMIETIAELLGSQYVLKPHNGGSSIGTLVVRNKEELYPALSKMFGSFDQILVEELIEGREATCGVLNDYREQPLYALPAIEIVPPKEATFFDHTVKYDGTTEEICPGRFSGEEKTELERLARLVHMKLELRQYSRSDFIVTPRGVYFLEVNTLPGLTSESLFPKAITAVGGTYEHLIDHLITHTLKQNRR